MASFGEDLKRERELRDISLEEISRATNISRSLLEALEQNNFSSLPGGAYTRGFIRSYARHVGIDIEEALNAFKAEMDRQEAAKQTDARPLPVQGMARPVGHAPETAVALSIFLTALLIVLIYWGGPSGGPAAAPPDPDAHGAALRARFKRAGKLPSLPLPDEDVLTEPFPPAENEETPPGTDEMEAPEILIVIRARETTRVQLTCSGRVEFDGELWVGAERHFPCRPPILLSAANGGAVEVGAAGSPMTLLGRDGERVQRREISVGEETPAPPAGLKEAASR